MADREEDQKCGYCKSHVYDSQKAVQCDGKCNFWFHIACVRVSDDKYRELSRDKAREWYCPGCDSVSGKSCSDGKYSVQALNTMARTQKLSKPIDEMNSGSRVSRKIGNIPVSSLDSSYQPLIDGQCLKAALENAEIKPKGTSNITTLKACREKEVSNRENPTNTQGSREVVWKCPLCCDMTFSNHISLMNHVEEFVAQVQCSGCLKQVGNVQEFLNHLKTDCSAAHATQMETAPKYCSDFVAASKEQSLNSKTVQSGVYNRSPCQSKSGHKVSQIDVTGHSNPCKEMIMPAKTVSTRIFTREGQKTFTTVPTKDKVRSRFKCSVCRTTFTCVEEHVMQYHSDQEVAVNRICVTEVYHPEPVNKRMRAAEGIVSKVVPSLYAPSGSVQQEDCDEIDLPSSWISTENGENESKKVRNGGSRKRGKILKVVLTRIADKELSELLKPSFEECDKKNYNRNVSSVSRISVDKINSSVSEMLKDKVLSNIVQGKIDTLVKTRNIASEIGKGQGVMSSVLSKSEKLSNTQSRHCMETGVVMLKSNTSSACSSANTRCAAVHKVADKCNIPVTSQGADRPVQTVVIPDDAFYCIFGDSVSGDQSLSVGGTGCPVRSRNTKHFSWQSVVRNKNNQIPRSTPVTVGNKIAERSIMARNGDSTFKIPLSSNTRLGSLASFSELVSAFKTSSPKGMTVADPTEESGCAGTPGVTYSKCGMPVSGVRCNPPLVMGPNNVPSFLVSRSKVVRDDVSNIYKGGTKRKLAMCDCVKNKDGDLIINKILDESGKILRSLYVCLRCRMGFSLYVIYLKHICEKSNFVCSCSKKNCETQKKMNIADDTVGPQPGAGDVNQVIKTGNKGTVADVSSWQNMISVSTVKTLVCSVCSNMFVRESPSFPNQNVFSLKRDCVPQNTGGRTANYTCKICSIVTEKRRGRVLVSKVDDGLNEAIEIVVVDPNADGTEACS